MMIFFCGSVLEVSHAPHLLFPAAAATTPQHMRLQPRICPAKFCFAPSFSISLDDVLSSFD
jgi:hypothetical protein